MANQRVLVTYDCLHFALLPTFYLDSVDNYNTTFDHFATTCDHDLVQYPTSDHLAIPGKCPSTDCSNCNAYAVLHPQLTTRSELLHELYSMLRQNYVYRGQHFHGVDLLIRMRNERNPECELAMEHYQNETSPWHEDGLLLPFHQIRSSIALAQQSIEDLSKSRSMSSTDRARLAKKLNDGLMSISKAVASGKELRKGVKFLQEKEKFLSAAQKKAAARARDPDHSKANFGVIGAMNRLRMAWEKRLEGSMFKV